MTGRTLTVVLRGGKRVRIDGVGDWAAHKESLTIDVYAPDGTLAGTIENVLVCFFED